METFRTKIPQLKIIVDDVAIILKSNENLECLSNAAVNGGRLKTRTIVNHQVPLDFQNTIIENVFIPIKKKYNLPNPIIGLMTAVKMNQAVIINNMIQDVDYVTVVTAGLSNIIAPHYDKSNFIIEDLNPLEHYPGTINIIIVFNCKLTECALVNLFITLTEAKTLLLNECDIRMSDGRLASGTSTDTIAIGFTGNGPLIKWSGYSTKFGQSVGKTTINALKNSLIKGEWI